MAGDDGSFLSRRLGWDPEDEPVVPEARADSGHTPGYEAESWDDEAGAGDADQTQTVATPGRGVVAGLSFERRELERLDMEALDRRRQLWRDTSLILSLLLVVLIGANVL